MKDLPFFMFMSILVIVLFSDFFNIHISQAEMTVCSLNHEAYTITKGKTVRNKDSDSLCLCKGT